MTNSNYFIYLVAFCVMLSGCELIGPHQREKLPLDVAGQNAVDAGGPDDVVFEELSNKAIDSKKGDNADIELFPGNGEFISQRPLQVAKTQKRQQGDAIQLNFDEIDIKQMVDVIFKDYLHENYVISPKVSGTVTLQTTRPLTKAELLPTLEMLLQINNAAMIYKEGMYQIRPVSEAQANGLLSRGYGKRRKLTAGYQIRVVPVRNVGVEDLAEIIKPLVEEQTILSVDSSRNLLLIAGTAGELARAIDIVNTFDVDIMKGRSFGLFPVKNVEAGKLVEELQQVFNQKSKDSGGQFIQFLEIERLNAILAITHQAKYLQDIETWVLRLDKANSESGGGGVIVYKAQNVDAVELATTLNDIFGGSGTQRERKASVASGRDAVKITNKSDKSTRTKQVRKPGDKSASLAGVNDVKIIADEINNALVIVATPQEYQIVYRVIKQLDVMPLQVLIDATIVDVTLTDKLEYGIKWFLSHDNGGDNAISSGGFDLTGTAADLAVGAATGGFGYGFISKSGDIRAVLNAAATDNNINVISSPSLMVLNNQEASIQVGNEISLRTSQNTPLTSGVGTDNTLISTSQLQQRKTGVKLKVKPRVNASGLVIMEIEQSVEDPGQAKNDGSNPDILTREITSSVAVNSGETIVLGGLIKENSTRTKSGIPVLHQIPLIGPLFGSTLKNKERTELVVLLTPRVVTSRQDARLVAREFKRKLSGIYEEPKMVEKALPEEGRAVPEQPVIREEQPAVKERE